MPSDTLSAENMRSGLAKMAGGRNKIGEAYCDLATLSMYYIEPEPSGN